MFIAVRLSIFVLLVVLGTTDVLVFLSTELSIAWNTTVVSRIGATSASLIAFAVFWISLFIIAATWLCSYLPQGAADSIDA